MVALQGPFHIAAKLFHPSVAHGYAKVAAGHIFQFVGLVEDDRAHLRQNAGIRRVLP